MYLYLKGLGIVFFFLFHSAVCEKKKKEKEVPSYVLQIVLVV
jgi:hypothetical protein